MDAYVGNVTLATVTDDGESYDPHAIIAGLRSAMNDSNGALLGWSVGSGNEGSDKPWEPIATITAAFTSVSELGRFREDCLAVGRRHGQRGIGWFSANSQNSWVGTGI